jgi:hypothetical protein
MTQIMTSIRSMVRVVFTASLIFAVITPSAQAFATKKLDATDAATASSPTLDSAAMVWVSRKDGATSCGIKKGQTLEEGADELKQNGVRVLSSRKGSDGKMHAQSCGMPTGTTNAYHISRDDLVKAVSLGFQESK